MTFDGFPENEIFVKLGGDHGGKSFKMFLQIANVLKPNSKQNTIVIGCFADKDFHANLSIIKKIFKQPIEELRTMNWQGKSIRLILFGDYAFFVIFMDFQEQQALTRAYGA